MKDVTQGYIDKEEAVQRKPVEIYHMWRDEGIHWRYTSGDVAIVYDGETYAPASLERSLVSYNSQLEITTMNIQIGALDDSIIEFISSNPVEILWIMVSKLHREQSPLEPDVVFIGQIKDVSFKGVSASVRCVGFEHFLKMPVPVWRYQLTCNHAVFDSKCALTAASYKVATAVTIDSTETQLTSNDFADETSGYFTRGKVVLGVESRTIVDHSGTVIKINYKFSELEAGDFVDVYPGCDGKIETCRDKYDNVDNFLGFPFMPVENPALRQP